ncbi:hypothetical protein L0Y65_05520 [Candidatus Micrarchaeota archaeon]|nr:hypothetical protein [Candidatus Micrarchaeota archaeon]
MVSRRNLDRNLALEKVDLVFYLVMERDGKKLLKPLKLDTKVPLKLVRAIADDTVIPAFYSQLAKDLLSRGVKSGSKVQVRAKFGPAHEMLDPALKGVRVLCEIDV